MRNNYPNRPLAAFGQASGTLPNELEQLVNRIFEQLLASCPNFKYWTEREINTAKQQWVLGFAENGITTMAQVRNGMKALRAKEDDFVPSVGKFIQWCKVTDYSELGLPKDTEALLKRLDKYSASIGTDYELRFKSDAEYWLITELYQRNRARQLSEKELASEARKSLDAMAKRVASGETIPKRRELLPKEPEKPTPSPEVIDARFVALRLRLGIKK